MKIGRAFVWACVIAVAACSGPGLDGVHIQQVTKYHHQIAANGKVIEGFVYGKIHFDRGNAVVAALGHPYLCSDGSEKFVLEEKMTILLLPTLKMLSEGQLSEVDRAVLEKSGYPLRKSDLKARLPMLFDSAGCSPEAQ